MLSDFRLALRQLIKAPGFSFVAISTLALGIGMSTVVFSALIALLLRPLPIEDPDRLVCGYAMRDGVNPYETSLLEYAAYRQRSHSFTSSGVASQRFFNLSVRGEPQGLPGAAVTAEYLTTLSVRPVLGRLFRPEEDRPGDPAVALISYELWQSLFGGDPAILGQPLKSEDLVYTVIGILPRGFNMPFAADIWVPLKLNIAGLPLEERARNKYDFLARLRPHLSLRQADRELRDIARSLEQEYPQIRHGWSYKLISLRQNLIGDLEGRTRKTLYALVAGVGLLLLICCANLASLLLAKGVARQREISIRLALGAGPFRIVRQLLTETLLLSLLGGLTGLLLASWIAPLLGRLSPIQAVSFVELLRDFRIDKHALGFIFLLSLLTAAICGSIPALRVTRACDLTTSMKQQRAASAPSARRLLDVLVSAEIALATTLLVAGSLLVQSFQSLQRINLGFRPENLLLVEMALSPSRYALHRQRVAFAGQVLERVRRLPGVVSAGTTTNYPLQLFDSASTFTVEGRPPPVSDPAPVTIHRAVSPGYLKTLGVTLLKGREVIDQDTAESLPVAVVNQELARQAWPGEEPMGKHLRRGSVTETSYPWLTVVGVVENVKEDRFKFRTDQPAWYLPYAQQETNSPLILAVRGSSNPAALTAAIRSAIHSVDPNQAIASVTTMKEYLGEVLMKERFSALLMGTLAVLGLILVALGLYGVLAYVVSQRTGEIGLRMALGGQARDIFKLVIGHGLMLIGIGLAIGLVAAQSLTRSLASTLYRINPLDAVTFAFVAILLAGVVLAACWFPARRAARLDPMITLRTE